MDEITDSIVKRNCVKTINVLLSSMNCISPEINSLNDLTDGSVLAELIDNFELVFSQTGKWYDNYSYINNWLDKHGFVLPNGTESVKKMLKSGNQNDLIMICYVIATIFIKNYDDLSKKIERFRMLIDMNSLIGINCYLKWKLLEDELIIKRNEVIRLQKRVKKLKKLKHDFNTVNAKQQQHKTVVENMKNSINNSSNSVDDIQKIRLDKLIADLVIEKLNEKKVKTQDLNLT